ncbi:MAG: hypothetical protein HOK81_12020 [Rhodospirillaceae bacterium]|jgi:hypothetical protein|nr:hypothetical protein [Rhodospirillaceae bacterium]
MRNIAAFTPFVFAAALSALPLGQDALGGEKSYSNTGYTKFSTLCREEAGHRQNGFQEGIDGYRIVDAVADVHEGNHGCDMICVSSLLKDGYKYIEMDVAIPDKQYLTEKTGKYRFSIQKAGDERCGLYEIFYSDYYNSHVDTFPFAKGNCIASETVDAFQARAVQELIYETVYKSDREEVFKYTNTKYYDDDVLDKLTLFSYKKSKKFTHEQCKKLTGKKERNRKTSDVFLIPEN